MDQFEEQNFSEEYEYNEPSAEPEPQPVNETPYRGNGAGRKESPFADSPYVMNHPSQEEEARRPRKPKKKKRSSGAGRKILAAILSLSVVAGSCGVTALMLNAHWTKRTNAMKKEFAQQIQALQGQIAENVADGNVVIGSAVSVEGSLTPSQVYALNANAVVLISNIATYNYFGQTGTATSSGSGFFISADGYVVTNYHVVEDATSLKVTMTDGTEYDATLIGGDQTNDVALLKVTGENFPHVAIGDSDVMTVGDQVVAIGNPLGELTNSLTVGYISAKDRQVTTDGTEISMMQTDVAINSGNSGGPLFNMQGQVVGITTAKYSGNSASGATIEGIGFAIPVNDVMDLVSDLKEFGYVKGAYMGITISDMDEQTATLAKVYGLPVGPIIQTVEANGAAARAGIKPGDIVMELGGKSISTVTELTRRLRDFQPGESSVVKIYRSGEKLELSITFGEKPAQTTQTPTVPQETVPNNDSNGNGGSGFGSGGWNPFFGWGE